MGVFFFFKNFVFMCVTLHKGVMIWLGKDEDEIEEYVRSQPQSPDSIESMIGRYCAPPTFISCITWNLY